MSALVNKMLDHYHLRERVGKGGMATVYRAVDTRNLREVAVKVLSPTMSANRMFLKRFRREAQLVKQHLTHPAIVPVIDYGQTKGYIYLVMPFIRGETLQERLAQGSISQEQAKLWVVQICDALALAHDRGIIHRDIKPSNVMIDEQGNALLTDFGLARQIESSDTLTGSLLMGTPAYISPEQGRGEKIDVRSDQYSLGVVLYQLATGRLPFENDKPMATVMAHMQEPVPRPRRFNQQISPDLERVILKTLAKRREDRFPSIRAMSEAYMACMDGKPLPQFRLPPETSPQIRLALEVINQTATVPKMASVPVSRPVTKRKLPLWIVPLTLLVFVAVTVVLLLNDSLLGLGGSGMVTVTQSSAGGALDTPQAVTATSMSPTPTLQPTNVPPITSERCPGISLSFLGEAGNEVSWLLDNQSGRSIRLNDLRDLSWDPLTKGSLEQVRFGDEVLWEGVIGLDDLQGAGTLGMRAEADKTIPENQYAIVTLHFQWGDPAENVYALALGLDAGCTLEGVW